MNRRRARVERGIFGPWSGTIGNTNYYVLRFSKQGKRIQVVRIAKEKQTSDQDKGG